MTETTSATSEGYTEVDYRAHEGQVDPPIRDEHGYPLRMITVVGRRWRDRMGNTYHTASVAIDWIAEGYENPGDGWEHATYIVTFTYGYGDQYLQSALELLQDEGILPRLAYSNGVPLDIRRICERHGIELRAHVADVPTKRELHAGGKA